jgi:hypothetical protein
MPSLEDMAAGGSKIFTKRNAPATLGQNPCSAQTLQYCLFSNQNTPSIV